MMFSRAQRKARLFARIGLLAVSGLACSVAVAQPLTVRVNPQLDQRGVLMSGNEPGTIETLFNAGPRYNEPSGVRIGRGSLIPPWLELGSFQNVSVPGLNPVGYYGYYISPDDRAVVVDLDSRRVVRVIVH
ncbi:hypothetical protein DA075_08020 [Methylobacterium currus]|jgi:hypothetical protein|uniref:DUF1236 domain-containing protein n=2 Tax=Methylobacterium currus TaxID=2051553 RepID=A0A2R4WH61_9HYPH|nr:hypothetical protein DA075_08020 [Methylobacterium currus]